MRKKRNALYHYTSEAGFLGIIASRSLWATDANFLNDATEIDLAHELAQERLKRKRRSRIPTFHKEALKVLGHRVSSYRLTMRTYVTCFSTRFDDLNQWRSYAGAANGYMIGFSWEQLAGFSAMHGRIFDECIYSKEDQIARIDLFIEEFLESVSGYFPFYEKGEINEGLLESRVETGAAKFTSQIAPFFKHQAFKEESEWRIVQVEDNENTSPEFRSTGLGITPYAILNLPKSHGLLSTIMLRSQTQEKLAEEGLARFLESQGIHRGIITLSQLPYRATSG